MKPALGIRRQIILSLSIMTFFIIMLAVVGTYIFYEVLYAYLPESVSETGIPSRVELSWVLASTLIALAIASYVAIKLSQRILAPLNSVAQNLREVAQGNLQARASIDSRTLGETAQLVHDFNAMAERLQKVTREREFWNAAIAHELRTPVTILRGRLQGLAEGVFTPSAELFEGLLRQVEGLNRLIEDLRVLSLRDSGHLDIQLANVRLADELSIVLQAFAEQLTVKGFYLHEELDVNLLVECDALRIRQALMALLENALRHADPGNLWVRLEQVGNDCQLSVEDDGPGIDSELTSEIFEAFRRGDPSRSRKSGGSGLGLAVVKAIAEAHGGNATCRASGMGSSFILSWPAGSQIAQR